VYLKLTNDEKAIKQRKMKKQLFQMKAELDSTSSQDEFAKWAKLRRKLDKAAADLEKLSKYFLSINTFVLIIIL
jgi:uncharacterized membrane-anchored protein YhcB (DUF1043 family)